MSLRIMVYSHDTFGLGNIRRMLAISQYLLDTIPGLSILLVTGSPVIHEFRLRPGLDYVKLPCLSRSGRDEYLAKTLNTGIAQLMQLRAGLILSAARHFQPDVLLVDKKPDGVKHELRPTLEHISAHRPGCRVALVLRDILDAPEVTMAAWKKHGFDATLRQYFDSILILGDPYVFDAAREYRFSSALRRMVRYCGYTRHPAPPAGDVRKLRARLLGDATRLVLVTPGGGEDGWNLVSSYLDGAARRTGVRSVIVSGPEMPDQLRAEIHRRAAAISNVHVMEFCDEMLPHMAAADVVVSMGGYNTICEILSLGKRAVVVPRAHPVQEQWIRSAKLARSGQIRAIHPDHLTPDSMSIAVAMELERSTEPPLFAASLEGLPNVARWVKAVPNIEAQRFLAGGLAWHASPTY